jgi:hypothetical protein
MRAVFRGRVNGGVVLFAIAPAIGFDVSPRPNEPLIAQRTESGRGDVNVAVDGQSLFSGCVAIVGTPSTVIVAAAESVYPRRLRTDSIASARQWRRHAVDAHSSNRLRCPRRLDDHW